MKPAEIKLLSEIEHVLQRPDMYVGSVLPVTAMRWVAEENKLVKKEITYIPAILKLFDEVISNSLDEGLKTGFKFSNKIMIYADKHEITISDNGRGLPTDFSENGNIRKATLAFTKLRAGSNFGNKGEISIGRFGVGVSLTNIFSLFFDVYTQNTDGGWLHLSCEDHNKRYEEKYKDKPGSPAGTKITYRLDFNYFNMKEYDDDHLGLLHKRIIDLAMIFPEVEFKWNGIKVRSSRFKDYCKMIDEDFVMFEDDNIKVAVFKSDDHDHISFVNGIETSRGGTHVEIVSNSISYKLREIINKKKKIDVKPSDIKNGLLFVISARNVSGIKFDSQTKERIINTIPELSPIFNNIPDEFIKVLFNNEEILKPIIDVYLIKEELKNRQEVKIKQKKILKKKIPKLLESISDERDKCSLFLAEGESAIGRFRQVRNIYYHAGLPLKGKVLNTIQATDKEVINNAELQDIMKAVGLDIHEKAEDIRYGQIIILTDADVDGNSISSLLLIFFHKYWPELFDRGVIRKYLSPIIIATKGKEVKRYYSLDAFREDRERIKDWNIKYYKGLGRLDESEYSKMINEPIQYVFTRNDATPESINIVFGSDANLRKEWLKL